MTKCVFIKEMFLNTTVYDKEALPYLDKEFLLCLDREMLTNSLCGKHVLTKTEMFYWVLAVKVLLLAMRLCDICVLTKKELHL